MKLAIHTRSSAAAGAAVCRQPLPVLPPGGGGGSSGPRGAAWERERDDVKIEKETKVEQRRKKFLTNVESGKKI